MAWLDADEHFVERLLAGQQADVGHADERQPRPTVGAHGAVGARGADGRGGFARGHIADELAVADDVGRLRGNAFVVESEGAQAGAVLEARVANHVDDFGAVAQMIQLVEREKAHARVVGLRAEHAVELDGMADGFVNLQSQLAAIQDQIEAAFGALIGRVQRHGLFGDARRVPQQIDFVNQLIALELVLAAEGVGIRALLDLVAFEAVGFESGAADGAGLIDDAADGRDEDLAAAMEDHGGLRQRDAGTAAQLFVDGE